MADVSEVVLADRRVEDGSNYLKAELAWFQEQGILAPLSGYLVVETLADGCQRPWWLVEG